VATGNLGTHEEKGGRTGKSFSNPTTLRDKRAKFVDGLFFEGEGACGSFAADQGRAGTG